MKIVTKTKAVAMITGITKRRNVFKNFTNLPLPFPTKPRNVPIKRNKTDATNKRVRFVITIFFKSKSVRLATTILERRKVRIVMKIEKTVKFITWVFSILSSIVLT